MPRQMKDSSVDWIGLIPNEWKLIPLKYLASYNDESLGESTDPEYEFDYIEIGSVQYGQGITGVEHMKFENAPSRARRIVQANDIIISTVRTYLKAIATVSESENQQIASTGFVVIRPRTVLPAFLNYAVLANSFISMVEAHSTGISYPAINATDVVRFKIPVPDIKEQKAIALFLDTKCEHIESVLEQTRASIEEYKKLKQAMITKVVTKGIRGDRCMKDSNIEWLGDIPEDWNVYRIANLYDERSENGLEELPILTVSINTGVSDYEIADEDKDRVFVRSEDRTKYKRVYPGDLAYNMMRAWQGAFGAVRVDGMVSPAYVVAKPKKNVELDSRYMEALLRTSEATEEMHRYSRGIVDFRLRLYWPEFKNIRICLPSIAEQIEIADYIDEKSAAIDALIAKKEAFVVELENYKKSMIYEYVTGKKEVL